MPSKEEIEIIKKAAAYDLLNLIGETPDKTYTTEEVRNLIKAYISGTEN